MNKEFSILNGYIVADIKARLCNNVAEMKEIVGLNDGDIISTIGYHEANDGGAATYKIRAKQEMDIEDKGSIHFINDTLVAELIVKNDTVNQMQFGCYGDNANDDTSSLNSLFNYAYEKQIGKVIFIKNKTHKITGTINLNKAVNVDFNNCIFKPYSGIYINDFMFLLNSNDGTNYLGRSDKDRSIINNLDLRNTELIENIKGLFVGNNAEINHVRSQSMYQTLVWVNAYIDYAKVNDVSINNSLGEKYQIYKTGNGDEVNFYAIHMILGENINKNLIFLSACQGGNLTNITNGNIEIRYSQGVTIKNCHSEFGKFVINNSSATLISNYFWKDSNEEKIVISDSQINYQYISRPITLINNEFLLPYGIPSLGEVDMIDDINIAGYKGQLHLINNKRSILPYGGNYNYCFTSGISIYNGSESLLINKFECTLSKKTINNDKRIVPSVDNSYNGYFNLNSLGQPNINIKQNTPLGTYYYNIVLLFDKERNLGIGKTGDNTSIKQLNVEYEDRPIQFNLNDKIIGNEVIYRIYRGLERHNYTNFVDIPSVSSLAVLDNGKYVNGFAWNTREAGEIDSINLCYGYEVINQKNIKAYCTSIPTSGNWKTGDIVIDITGTNYGWVCVAEGTPGTWKKIVLSEE